MPFYNLYIERPSYYRKQFSKKPLPYCMKIIIDAYLLLFSYSKVNINKT